MCTFKQPAASTLATPDCLLETDFSFSSLSPFLSLLFSPNSSVVIGKRGFSAAALESSEDGLASSETHGTFTVLTVQSSLPWQQGCCISRAITKLQKLGTLAPCGIPVTSNVRRPPPSMSDRVALVSLCCACTN